MENIQAGKVAPIQRAFAQPGTARAGSVSVRAFSETDRELSDKVATVLSQFTQWLDKYGETSWDHQSFFAGPVGGRAKALYYKKRSIGTVAVAPLIFCEAIFPSARRLFHHPIRFPIADAHYATGFAFLYHTTSDRAHLEKPLHFLNELKKSCH